MNQRHTVHACKGIFFHLPCLLHNLCQRIGETAPYALHQLCGESTGHISKSIRFSMIYKQAAG